MNVTIVRTEYISVGRYYSYLINSCFSRHLLCTVAESLNIIFGTWVLFIKNVYTECFFSRLNSQHINYHELICDKCGIDCRSEMFLILQFKFFMITLCPKNASLLIKMHTTRIINPNSISFKIHQCATSSYKAKQDLNSTLRTLTFTKQQKFGTIF